MFSPKISFQLLFWSFHVSFQAVYLNIKNQWQKWQNHKQNSRLHKTTFRITPSRAKRWSTRKGFILTRPATELYQFWGRMKLPGSSVESPARGRKNDPSQNEMSRRQTDQNITIPWGSGGLWWWKCIPSCLTKHPTGKKKTRSGCNLPQMVYPIMIPWFPVFHRDPMGSQDLPTAGWLVRCSSTPLFVPPSDMGAKKLLTDT